VFKKEQAFLIVSCLLLIALLYIFGERSQPVTKNAIVEFKEPSVEIDFEKITQNIKKRIDSLKRDSLTTIEQQLADASNAEDKQANLKRLIAQWESMGYIQISAYYRKQLAHLDSTKNNWEAAAKSMWAAFQVPADSTVRSFLLENAVSAYQKTLQFDSTNIDAKITLAQCYTDDFNTQPMVMQGVFLLREVIDKDSVNIPANLMLGRLSITSGQFDKALKRFHTIVRNDTTNAQAFCYLGETYLNLKKKEQSIKYFRKCRALVKNPIFGQQLDSLMTTIIQEKNVNL